MVQLDEYKAKINQYREPMEELKRSLELEKKKATIEELEAKMEEPDFWSAPEKAQEITRELKNLKDTADTFSGLEEMTEDILTLIEMGYEENDESLLPEIEEMLEEFIKTFEEMRIKTLLSGEYDANNAIVTLHAGAGGTESCDWAGMLYRMYTKWAESHGYKTEVLDYLDGDEAGIKSITFEVKGENALGYLKSEKGVHRLVRISPFINKTDSAIRITHLPTGVVVQCQNERSQHKNKDKAMQMLKAKLYLIKEQENREKLSDIRGEVSDNGWGNQIRSYVMQPYTLVKDHRTGEESGNVQSVMDGNLDAFMNAYLRYITTSAQEEQ